MRIIVTGGSGFIGSAVVRHLVGRTDHEVLNVDKLGYSSSEASTASVAGDSRYRFEQVDIVDYLRLEGLFRDYQPDAVLHLAAESHVDRSIDSPRPFIESNVVGTFNLLETSRRYLETLPRSRRDGFRFHHVSTDEVYGDLGDSGMFVESSPYQPSSPYSASKAASDHLVRAWNRTYGLPVLLTNCSNNYGPFQHPEKLIPTMILAASSGQSLPVYGDGGQVRDWLFVEDHAAALLAVLERGSVGETYNIGGDSERRNIDVVRLICAELDARALPRPDGIERFDQLITFVTDRPGHDRRYAIDATKIRRDLGWAPAHSFEQAMSLTVSWYLANEQWCREMVGATHYGQRLGLGAQ
ncbi:MAG: dTDP-glucose 4,6-dehydratase [Gammaproteobacteria bacterium]